VEGRNFFEVTWMASEMFPLYMKTNRADGENYYWLRRGGLGRGGGRIFTIWTTEFLDNGTICSISQVRKRTFSIASKHMQNTSEVRHRRRVGSITNTIVYYT